MGSAGFSVLPQILDDEKLHLARRLLLFGINPTVDALRARGASPTAEQAARLAGVEPYATQIVSCVLSADGARRLVLSLHDQQRVETVLMGDGGVCVSTQVGCAVGCRFCASGIGGLVRNLDATEILEQVAHARAIDPQLRRVVYMGIGEPTHNLDAVLEAAEILAADGEVHERSQTLSTVGSVRAFARLRDARVRPSVALSLHSADDVLRKELLPRASRDSVAELVAAAEEYAVATGREIQWAVALLAGINDRDVDVELLVELLSGKRGYLNLIPWNAVDELDYARPSREHALAFTKALRDRGIFTTLRWSAGADADAACGQLRRQRVS